MAKANFYIETFIVIMANGKMVILLDMANKIIMSKECIKETLKRAKNKVKEFMLGIKVEVNITVIFKMV
jgi:hypothetical protein